MLTKQARAKLVKHKLLNSRFGRIEVTSLTKQEVLNIYSDTGLTHILVVWHTNSATYFKIENNLN